MDAAALVSLQHIPGGQFDEGARLLGLLRTLVISHALQALPPEIGQPALRLGRFGQIGLAQKQHAPLMADELVQRGIPAGLRKPCVAQLHHQIHLAQLRTEQPLGLGHMTRIPLNVQTKNPFRPPSRVSRQKRSTY